MNSPHPTARLVQRHQSRRTLAVAFLSALAAIVFIFVLYEIVERTWLVDADRGVLHRLHIARGIGSSVVAALLVGWCVLRTSPPLLTTVHPHEEWNRQWPDAQHTSEVNYAAWFIRMRWIAVVVAITFVISCVRIVPLLPRTVLWPLLFTLLALAGSNVIYVLISRRGVSSRMFLQAQVYCDLVILTILLHFSGGIENPLSILMLLHVIIGGIILARWQCYMVAAVGSVLFALLAIAEAAHIVEHYTLQVVPHIESDELVQHAAYMPLYVTVRIVLQTSLLSLVAYFVTTVTERLRMHEIELRHMAARAVAESQLLERSLDTTGAALRVLGPDLHPRWSNSRWQSWFGEESSHTTMVERLEGEGSAARQTYRDGLTRRSELTTEERDIDGADAPGPDTRYYQVTTAPMRDPDGNVSGIVELAQDITEQKRTQAQFIRASQLAAVGELAGEVAHEVNNPIAIIGAKGRLLLSDQRDEMSDTVAAELGKIIALSDRVAKIAQGLLSYCRPSGAARSELDIRTPVRAALAMLDQHAARTNVQVVTHLPGGLPSVRANQQEMEQVFLNLLLNALDAMPDGGTLTVSVQGESGSGVEGAGRVVIRVEDTGEGVPPESRAHVFRPFFTTKKQGRGTGLGLSICQGLITSHGGTITLDSQDRVGTCVTIALPAASDHHHQKEPHV